MLNFKYVDREEVDKEKEINFFRIIKGKLYFLMENLICNYNIIFKK